MASIKKTFSIIRPADTTAYSVGDVINANGSTAPVVIDLTDLSGKASWLLGAQLISSYESGTPSISVHIFTDTFTIAADNSAFNPTDTNLKTCIATISFSSWSSFSANKKSSAATTYPESISMNKLYAVFVADSTYTPASSEEITCVISINQEL